MKKRKIKLFASIASLAMVVAVMGVGVFAATQQTITIGTHAKFVATGIAADVYAHEGTAETARGAFKDSGYETAVPTSWDGTTLENNWKLATFDVDRTDLTLTSSETIYLSLQDTDNDGFLTAADTGITIVFTVKNTGTTPIYLNATAGDSTATSEAVGVKAVVLTADQAEKTIAVGGSATISVTYSVDVPTGVTAPSSMADAEAPSVTLTLKNKATN